MHSRALHVAKCSCAQLLSAEPFPERTDRHVILFDLKFNSSDEQVARYQKMWLLTPSSLHYFFSREQIDTLYRM